MNQLSPPSSFIARAKARLLACLPNTPLSWMAWSALPLVLGGSFVAFSAGLPPNYPAVSLASGSLYSAVTVEKPALTLALSVEFPTVGAQYNPGVEGATTDSTYTPTNEYLGYYDAESCYRYIDAPSETPATGLTADDYKRFERIGAATSRSCTDAFSGNFLNWASNSAIDMLRLALSGGDRYIDTTDLTILQRAVIPNEGLTCMWNSQNFPAKQLSRNGGGTGNYWGAVPLAMRTAAGSNDVWVANTLNRIYFGTSITGNCSNPYDYALGAPYAGKSEWPPRSVTAPLPADATLCINGESGNCSFSGSREVWYGSGSNWKVLRAKDGYDCNASCNTNLGDPIPGVAKKVYYTKHPGGTLNSDGFFYARVQVCNADVSGMLQDVRDYGLCKQ